MRRLPIKIVFAMTLQVGLLAGLVHAQSTTRPASAEDKLEMRIDIDLTGLTIQQAVVAIQDKVRLNISANWLELEIEGISRTKHLRGRLRDVTVRQALDLALNEAGAESPFILAIVDDGVEIKGPVHLVTTVYPVRSLLAKYARDNPEAAADELMAMIIHAVLAVDQDTWRDNGGTIGALRGLGKQLIVTQSPETQKKVEQMLRDLEKSDAR